MTVVETPEAAAVARPEAGVARTASPAHRSPPATVEVMTADPPSVLGDLRQLVRDLRVARDLLMQLTLRDIRVRYKQAAFGFAWALLIPAVVVGAGLGIRYALAYTAGVRIDSHQLAGMALKSVPWAFFVGCLNSTTASLITNITLVTKVYFPREVLPLGAVLAQTFDSMIGGIIVTLMMPLFGVTASMQLLWVPVLLVCLWTLSLALGLFLSCANLFFRDVKYLVQVFLTFGIFVTPVLLDVSMYGPRGASIMMLNPVAPILEGLRLAVVEHHNLLTPYTSSRGFVIWRPWYLAYSGGLAFFGLLASAVVFRRSERRFAEII